MTQKYLQTKRYEGSWLVQLSGLSAGLWTKGSLVWFPVRAPARVMGQVPSSGCIRSSYTLMFLSLSFSFSSLLSKNKWILKKKKDLKDPFPYENNILQWGQKPTFISIGRVIIISALFDASVDVFREGHPVVWKWPAMVFCMWDLRGPIRLLSTRLVMSPHLCSSRWKNALSGCSGRSCCSVALKWSPWAADPGEPIHSLRVLPAWVEVWHNGLREAQVALAARMAQCPCAQLGPEPTAPWQSQRHSSPSCPGLTPLP